MKVWLKTTRVSAVVAAFLDRYPEAEVSLDVKKVSAVDRGWCTNASLKSARDFSVVSAGVEILAFHDGYRNMWAASEQKEFVNVLGQQQLLRVQPEVVTGTSRVVTYQPGLLRRFLARVLGA